MTKLEVTYYDGEPQKITFGPGLMGEHTSLAYMDGSTAVVQFNNAGSTNFVKEVKKLPFVQAVKE